MVLATVTLVNRRTHHDRLVVVAVRNLDGNITTRREPDGLGCVPDAAVSGR